MWTNYTLGEGDMEQDMFRCYVSCLNDKCSVAPETELQPHAGIMLFSWIAARARQTVKPDGDLLSNRTTQQDRKAKQEDVANRDQVT